MEKQNQSTLTIVMGENGKYGVRNQWGVMKQLCVFDRIEPNGEGTLWTYKDDLMGCVEDQDGDTMVSCRWKEVKDMEDFYFKVMDGSGKWGVVSDANEQVLPCKWNDIKTGIEDQYIVQDNCGLWGVTECDGYMVIPCQWNKIENTLFHYLVKDTEEKTSIYNRYGQMLSECQWKAVEYLWSSEETFQVQAENGLWGVLDGKGTLVFQCVWKSIVKDNSLLYVTDNEGRVWVMNVQGEMLEPCRWAEIKKGDRSEGRIVIDWNGKYGYLNKKWELSIPCQWRDMQYAFNSFIVCDPYGKYGVIGMDGSIIINCEWGMVGHTEGILYSVQDKNGLWGAFDWKGNKILVMGNKHLWGWLDLNGGIIIPCTYPSDSALLDDMKTSRNKGITTTDVFRIDDEKLEVTKYQRWQSEHEIPLSELTLPWNLKHDEFTGEVIKDKAYELCVKAAPRFKELVELIKKNKV